MPAGMVFVSLECFRQQSVARSGELLDADLARLHALHRPETRVAGPVLEVAPVVGRATEGHLARDTLRAPLVGRAVVVLARADELLHARRLRLVELLHLANLIEPDALYRLEGILGLEIEVRVGE